MSKAEWIFGVESEKTCDLGTAAHKLNRFGRRKSELGVRVECLIEV